MDFSDNEYLIPYILTLVLIISKFIFSYYLHNVDKKTEEKNYFIHTAFILMMFIAFSRISYFIFDFYLTKFDYDCQAVS